MILSTSRAPYVHDNKATKPYLSLARLWTNKSPLFRSRTYLAITQKPFIVVLCPFAFINWFIQDKSLQVEAPQMSLDGAGSEDPVKCLGNSLCNYISLRVVQVQNLRRN